MKKNIVLAATICLSASSFRCCCFLFIFYPASFLGGFSSNKKAPEKTGASISAGHHNKQRLFF